MRDIIKPSLPLLVICLVTAMCLAAVNFITKDAIAMRVQEDAEAQRKQVMPSAEKFEEVKGWEVRTNGTGVLKEVFKAYTAGKPSGYVFAGSPKGYAGPIKVTVGIGLDGKVTGVKIGDNTETPGLGTKTAEGAFIGQYKGKKAGNKIEVVKKKPSNENEVEAVSGATISSKAVTSAVQAASDLAAVFIKEDGGKK